MKIGGTLSLLLLLFSSSVLTGQEVEYSLPEWGLAFTLPDGWNAVDTAVGSPGTGDPLLRLAATDSVGQSMTLHIVEAPTWWVVSSPDVQAKIDGSMIGEGTVPTSREVVQHDGQEAYRFEGVWDRDSFDLRVAGIFILANGRGYSLSFTTLSKLSPFEHPHVEKIVSSFQLLGEIEPHVKTDTLEPYTIERQGVSLVVPGGWQDMSVDPESDGALVIRTADMMRERAIYVERIPDFPPISPDDSVLVAEMTGRLSRSGFQLTSPPEVIDFHGRHTLSLSGMIPGEALGHLLVIPAEGEEPGTGTTVMVVVQGGALRDKGALTDPVIGDIIKSLRIEP